MDGYHARATQEHQDHINRAHYLARLITFSFHDHKNMPDPPGPKAKSVEQPRDADHAQVSAFFRAMATKEK